MMASNVSIHTGSAQTSFHDCDVCKYQNTTCEAVSYCTSCDEYLCNACTKAHKGSKLTRHHKLLMENKPPSATTAAKSISPIMFCEDHKTMVVNIYCKYHDYVICNTCKLTSHRHCNTTDINQQSNQMETNGFFKETLTRLDELKSEYDKLKASRNKDKKRVKSELDKCLQDMRQIRKDVNEALDQIEHNLSKEIRQVNEITTKDIENHNAILDDALAQISNQVKSLKECEKARDDDVMYVGMKKASNITSRYWDIISKMEDELDRTEMTFQINGELYDMVKHLRSVASVLIDNSRVSLQTTGLTDGHWSCGGILYSRQTQKSLINVSISGKRDINVGSRGVYGCTFMSDGQLVLCCDNKGLILLNKDFTVKSRLYVRTRRVASINHNEIVITSETEKNIQKVKLFPSMEVTGTMWMDKDCYGVAVSGEEIYVTCYEGYGGDGEVRVLNLNGEEKRRLGMNNGVSIFECPDYVTVNKDGSKVFVSDSSTHSVTCLDKQGRVIYQCSNTYLRHPAGMYVDREDNLLICGRDSNNVHLIGHDGRTGKIVLSKRDGIERPFCTAFRQSDGCLVVGMVAGIIRALISFIAK